MQIREGCKWRIADNRTRNKEDPPPPVCPWGYKVPALGSVRRPVMGQQGCTRDTFPHRTGRITARQRASR